MRGNLGCRVIATILALQIDTIHAQLRDLRGKLGRHMAPEVYELAIQSLRDQSMQTLGIQIQQMLKLSPAGPLGRELTRIDPDRIDRRAYSQRMTFAIHDLAAMRDDVNHP